MLAMVEAEMSIKPSAPRCNRSGASGAFVSENGADAASLICLPPSRALRWLREAGSSPPGHRNGPDGPYAAFGPAAAAWLHRPELTPSVSFVSLPRGRSAVD